MRLQTFENRYMRARLNIDIRRACKGTGWVCVITGPSHVTRKRHAVFFEGGKLASVTAKGRTSREAYRKALRKLAGKNITVIGNAIDLTIRSPCKLTP